MNILNYFLVVCTLSAVFATEVQPVNILDRVSNLKADAVYQEGLDPKAVQQTIKDIKYKAGEKAWSTSIESSIVPKLARYYAISTKSWNQKLIELTNGLKPVFSNAAWTEIIFQVLSERLPMGILKDSSTQLFTDYLPRAEGQLPIESYPLQNPAITICNDTLNDPLLPNKVNPVSLNGYTAGAAINVPVGYYLLTPSANPKGLIIRVYGGFLASEAQTKKYKGIPSAFDKKLLAQGYAIAYLNLADLHENTTFQARMPEPMFDKVLAGIKVFIDAIKGSAIHTQVNCFAGKPIFLMGESFGGSTVTGFMRKYPHYIKGGISLNGGLCYKALNEFCELHIDASSPANLAKLQDPLLVLQAWNDNTVIPGAFKMFLDLAEQAGKAHLIHPFMIKMANEKVAATDKQIYIGHYLPARESDLDCVVQQVLSFMTNPNRLSSLDKAVDKKRASIIKNYAALNSKQQSFDDILMGMMRKWYEERLNVGGKRNQDFAKEWADYYLPQYVALIHEMATDTFEFKINANVIQEAKSRVNSLPKSQVDGGLWKTQIRRSLKEELKPIGLAEYINEGHIQAVMESVGVIPITKPYAARIGFQALAKFYVIEESPELNSVKEQVQGWIKDWMTDSGNIWRETVFTNRIEILKNKTVELRELARNKVIEARAKAIDSEIEWLRNYFTPETLNDDHLRTLTEYICDYLPEIGITVEGLTFAKGLMPRVLQGLPPLNADSDVDIFLYTLNYLSSNVPSDKYGTFKKALDGKFSEAELAGIIPIERQELMPLFIKFIKGEQGVPLDDRYQFICWMSSASQHEIGIFTK